MTRAYLNALAQAPWHCSTQGLKRGGVKEHHVQHRLLQPSFKRTQTLLAARFTIALKLTKGSVGSCCVQVIQDDGALLSCMINATCAALLDAGVPLTSLFGEHPQQHDAPAASCVCSKLASKGQLKGCGCSLPLCLCLAQHPSHVRCCQGLRWWWTPPAKRRR